MTEKRFAMKTRKCLEGRILLVISLAIMPVMARAESGKYNQVFFRSGFAYLTDDRSGEVFTDTGNAGGPNNSKGGFNVSAGLDLGLVTGDSLNGNSLLGEILIEYSRFSNKNVVTTTSALLGAPTVDRVAVSELNVTVAPKLRLDSLGPVRPFIVPIGLSFLVNSPPSNNTTYLDVGVHFAGGLDIKVAEQVSLGADIRYTHGFETADTHNRYLSGGGYLGINF